MDMAGMKAVDVKLDSNTGRLGSSLHQAELDSATCLFIWVRDIVFCLR